MRNRNKRARKKNNVVSLVFSASFYYHKAVRALENYNYHKALKYFQRAAEFEPDNPVNHCNVAGILSEMGQYEESNRILRHILKEIDPNFHECYLYMANNYANMEEFELAEEYVLQYMRRDPDGIYREEAEELLDFLCMELGRPPKAIAAGKEAKLLEDHDAARNLLEQGRFEEASRLLRQIIRRHPDFIPARNNLSLVHYYSGHLDQAIRETKKVLELEPQNLHALCNLAIYLFDSGKGREARELLERLKKVHPIHTEPLYKLAVTLELLGEHADAYRRFAELYSRHGLNTPHLLYHLVLTASQQGEWGLAERWWNKLRAMPEGKELSEQFFSIQEPASLRTDSRLRKFYAEILETLNRHGCPQTIRVLVEADKRIQQLFRHHRERLDKVRKLEGIAAALEYAVLSSLRETQKSEVAKRYGVSLSTLNKYLGLFHSPKP